MYQKYVIWKNGTARGNTLEQFKLYNHYFVITSERLKTFVSPRKRRITPTADDQPEPVKTISTGQRCITPTAGDQTVKAISTGQRRITSTAGDQPEPVKTISTGQRRITSTAGDQPEPVKTISTGQRHITSTAGDQPEPVKTISTGQRHITSTASDQPEPVKAISTGQRHITSTASDQPEPVKAISTGQRHITSTASDQPEPVKTISTGQRHITSTAGDQPVKAISTGQRHITSTAGDQPVKAISTGQRHLTSTAGDQPVKTISTGQRHITSTASDQPEPVKTISTGQRRITSTTGDKPEKAISTGQRHITSTAGDQPVKTISTGQRRITSTAGDQPVKTISTGQRHITSTASDQPEPVKTISTGQRRITPTASDQPEPVKTISTGQRCITPTAGDQPVKAISTGQRHITSTAGDQPVKATSTGQRRITSTASDQPEPVKTISTGQRRITPKASDQPVKAISTGQRHITSTAGDQPEPVKTISTGQRHITSTAGDQHLEVGDYIVTDTCELVKVFSPGLDTLRKHITTQHNNISGDCDIDDHPQDPDWTDSGSASATDSECADEDTSSPVQITKQSDDRVIDEETAIILSPMKKLMTIAVKGNTSASSTYKKPHRPCPFCDKMQSKLTRHLIDIHSTEKAVSEALKLPKGAQCNDAFAQLRKDGIFNENQKRVKVRSKDLLCERASQQAGQLSICGYCKGYFKEKLMWKHARICSVASDRNTFSAPVPVRILKTGVDVNNFKSTQDFKMEILSRFRNDEVGQICIADRMIATFGQRYWEGTTKTERQGTMSAMRSLGHLLVHFRQLDQPNANGEDMVMPSNFPLLEEALRLLVEKDDGETKVNLLLSVGAHLKNAAKIMKGVYLMQNETAKASNMDTFICILDINSAFLFGDARRKVHRTHEGKLRRPQEQPLEGDLITLRNYQNKKIEQLTADPFQLWTTVEYNQLRSVLVSRLTLFNGRRGGEPSRLLLSEWNDAEKGTWIDKSVIEQATDPADVYLLAKYKLAYQGGKGRALVPVLLPDNCLDAIRKLIDVRTQVGVHAANNYVFAFTGRSLDHCRGWDAVAETVKEAGLVAPHLVTATRMRHLVATAYSLLDVSPAEREAFLKHISHSDEVDRNKYQDPPSYLEVCRVGRILDGIDTGSMSHTATRKIQEINVLHDVSRESLDTDLCQGSRVCHPTMASASVASPVGYFDNADITNTTGIVAANQSKGL
jgi:hypothetical protein